ncbi:TrbI F-type domain-containing protein [Thiomonas sp.]
MESRSSLFAAVAGIALVCGALGGAGGVWLGSHFGVLSVGQPKIVTFDVTKLINAERAVAGGLLGKTKNENASIVLARVSSLVRRTITQEAGPGTIVLVKQGVVSKNVPDITDSVLAQLGLPAKATTATPMRYATQIAPTDMSYSYAGQAQQRQIQQTWQKTIQENAQNQRAQNAAVLP